MSVALCKGSNRLVSETKIMLTPGISIGRGSSPVHRLDCGLCAECGELVMTYGGFAHNHPAKPVYKHGRVRATMEMCCSIPVFYTDDEAEIKAQQLASEVNTEIVRRAQEWLDSRYSNAHVIGIKGNVMVRLDEDG